MTGEKPQRRVCRRCGFLPIHKADHGYYGTMRLCLTALLGYDCKRFVPLGHRAPDNA